MYCICGIKNVYLHDTSNCSGERTFSVLKRVRNQLRSSKGQKRLNSLALLCIENKILERIDADDVINRFALSKIQEICLLHVFNKYMLCVYFSFIIFQL